MADQEIITPGPCGPGGCPPPTEIECIEVFKVYDLCFQPETVTRDFDVTTGEFNEICPPPASCPVGTPVPCQLGVPSCTELSRTPQAETPGFAQVVVQITVPVNLFPIGTTFPTTTEPVVTETVTLTKRVILCAPTGTTVACNITGSCDCMVLTLDPTIECTLTLCIVLKTIADVNLLVPSYGFCIPAECVTMGLACPPGAPPQCTFTAAG